MASLYSSDVVQWKTIIIHPERIYESKYFISANIVQNKICKKDIIENDLNITYLI